MGYGATVMLLEALLALSVLLDGKSSQFAFSWSPSLRADIAFCGILQGL